MGQVIAFPQRRREPRFAAARKLALQLGYLLGFFLALPMTALMAAKYVAVTQPVGAVACVGLFLVAARLTVAAHQRI